MATAYGHVGHSTRSNATAAHSKPKPDTTNSRTTAEFETIHIHTHTPQKRGKYPAASLLALARALDQAERHGGVGWLLGCSHDQLSQPGSATLPISTGSDLRGSVSTLIKTPKLRNPRQPETSPSMRERKKGRRAHLGIPAVALPCPAEWKVLSVICATTTTTRDVRTGHVASGAHQTVGIGTCVDGSPTDWAATAPTASPGCTIERAYLRNAN
eukprot:3055407-Rhodomonas_salina.9